MPIFSRYRASLLILGLVVLILAGAGLVVWYSDRSPEPIISPSTPTKSLMDLAPDEELPTALWALLLEQIKSAAQHDFQSNCTQSLKSTGEHHIFEYRRVGPRISDHFIIEGSATISAMPNQLIVANDNYYLKNEFTEGYWLLVRNDQLKKMVPDGVYRLWANENYLTLSLKKMVFDASELKTPTVIYRKEATCENAQCLQVEISFSGQHEQAHQYLFFSETRREQNLLLAHEVSSPDYNLQCRFGYKNLKRISLPGSAEVNDLRKVDLDEVEGLRSNLPKVSMLGL